MAVHCNTDTSTPDTDIEGTGNTYTLHKGYIKVIHTQVTLTEVTQAKLRNKKLIILEMQAKLREIYVLR